MIRADHTSTERYAGRTWAVAAVGGECNEHVDCHVEKGQRIVLRHSGVSTDEETGEKIVDFSAAEWGCINENNEET